jgi:hypothetical protein
MRRAAAAILALLLAGCPARTSVYAPRLPDTDFHREAMEKKSCTECHEAGKIRHHAAADPCTKCHQICRGCR